MGQLKDSTKNVHFVVVNNSGVPTARCWLVLVLCPLYLAPLIRCAVKTPNVV